MGFRSIAIENLKINANKQTNEKVDRAIKMHFI